MRIHTPNVFKHVDNYLFIAPMNIGNATGSTLPKNC